MIKLVNANTAITKVAGRGGLILQKHSPEILLTVGVVGIIGSTIMACKATLKVEDVLDEHRKKGLKIGAARMKVEKGELSPEEYTEEDWRKDSAILKIQTGVNLAKLYAPAVTLSVASIACILGSHNIMQKRNVALVAAYKAVEQSFSDYRKRVVAELGDDKDRQFKYGITQETVTETEVDPETGKKKKVTSVTESMNPLDYSQYARIFDESNPEWSKMPDYNRMFLQQQQNYANDLLNSRGHVFLNEVYDMLGFERSQAGAVVGWVKGKGDDYIDFGMFNLNSEKARDFVNGYERSIVLDFNVDGVIWDLI
jgi:hypothetical protein